MLLCLLLANTQQEFHENNFERYSHHQKAVVYTQNIGQWDREVCFQAKYPGANVWVTSKGITYAFNSAAKQKKGYAVGVEFVGASGKGRAVGISPQQRVSNFYSGKDKSKWVSGAPSFSSAMVKDLYPGIDLVSYVDARQGMPRYDLIVHPGADASKIRMRYNGAKNLHTDQDGQICYDTPMGRVVEQQQLGIQPGNKKADRRFQVSQRIEKDGTVAFNVEGYDKTKTLVIDPLIYSTYLGGQSGATSINGIALDSSGTNYLVGEDASGDFPGADGETFTGDDVIVSAIASDGQSVLWSTYLGGLEDVDYGSGIAVEDDAKVLIAGQALSYDFPVTDTTIRTSGIGLYAARLDASSGSLINSTILGNSALFDTPKIACSDSTIYVGTSTGSGRYVSTGAFQATYGGSSSDAYVVAIDSATFARSGATYVGGTAFDLFGDISVAPDGTVYLAYSTTSSRTFANGTPYKSTRTGSWDAVVVGLSADLTSQTCYTYLGGSGIDQAQAIKATDEYIAVGGLTASANWPRTANALPYSDPVPGLAGTVTVLDPALSELVYSTSIGTEGAGRVNAIDVKDGIVAFAGYADSAEFVMPCTPNAYQDSVYPAFVPAFFGAYNIEAGELDMLSYFWGDYTTAATGVAVAKAKEIRLVGNTNSGSLPLLDPIQSTASEFGCGFLTAIDISRLRTGVANITTARGDTPHIAGGVSLTMDVTVSLADDLGGEVTLRSGDPGLVFIHGSGAEEQSKLIPAGQTSATFTVEVTGPVSSTTDVELIASSVTGPDTKSLTVTVEPFITGVVLQYPTLLGDRQMNARVQIYEPPAQDLYVQVFTDSAHASTEGSVLIPNGGSRSEYFNVFTRAVDSDEDVTVTARYGSNEASSSFQLQTADLVSFTFSPETIWSGSSGSAAVKFQTNVASDKVVHVTSSDPTIIPNFDLTVFQTQKSTSDYVRVSTIYGSTNKKVTLTATYGSRSIKKVVTVNPTYLNIFSPARTAVAEGNGIPVTIQFRTPPGADQTVFITSTDPSVVPNMTVPVSAGFQTVNANIPTVNKNLTSKKTVSISATVGTITKKFSVSVNPAISSIAMSPASVQGGEASSLIVTLFEPLSYALDISIASSSAYARPPVTFTLPNEHPSVSITVPTNTTSANRSSKITVRNGKWSQQTTLVITP